MKAHNKNKFNIISFFIFIILLNFINTNAAINHWMTFEPINKSITFLKTSYNNTKSAVQPKTYLKMIRKATKESFFDTSRTLYTLRENRVTIGSSKPKGDTIDSEYINIALFRVIDPEEYCPNHNGEKILTPIELKDKIVMSLVNISKHIKKIKNLYCEMILNKSDKLIFSESYKNLSIECILINKESNKKTNLHLGFELLINPNATEYIIDLIKKFLTH